MHHSYEGLDRPGGFSRVRMLTPLRHRDFRLLWSGMCVSLIGDGIFLVAMAWQVYELWNAPAALSVIGIAMTVPTIACLLPGGVVSDRFDRRTVMLAADGLRAAVIGLLAVLSATGLFAGTGLMATGMSVLTGSAIAATGAAAGFAGAVGAGFASVVGAGLAGATGSVIGQGVAIATGMQESFSWRSRPLAR